MHNGRSDNLVIPRGDHGSVEPCGAAAESARTCLAWGMSCGALLVRFGSVRFSSASACMSVRVAGAGRCFCREDGEVK